MNLADLARALEQAWCADTACGIWLPYCPSLNQCAVTALVVQDYLGGELLRCDMTDGDSHYWNRLPDGTEIDLTAEQFECIDAQPIWETVVVRSRVYVLSFPDTALRYVLLRSRVESFGK